MSPGAVRARPGGALALTLAFLALALAVPGAVPSRADDAGSRPLAGRRDDVVVLPGAQFPRLRGIHKDRLRAFAWRGSAFEAVPVQVDERTPSLDYCWTRGPDPQRDVDDGRLDDDDEVVLRASDAGAAPPDASAARALAASASHEVTLEDPRTGAIGRFVVAAFEGQDPPRPSAPGPVFLPDGNGGLTFGCERAGGAPLSFEIAGTTSLSRSDARDGERARPLGPSLLRGGLHASYLFARIERGPGEVRASIGSSWIDGPIRALAPATFEIYLIWGNWLSATRSVVAVTGRTLSVRARWSVPVSLDAETPSAAWIGVEPPRSSVGARFKNDRNPTPRPLDALRGLDLGFPSWNLVESPAGCLLTRVVLDERLAGGRHSLHVGEDGTTGFRLDLTALKRTDEGHPYELTYETSFLEAADDQAALCLVRDAPLRSAVR